MIITSAAHHNILSAHKGKVHITPRTLKNIAALITLGKCRMPPPVDQEHYSFFVLKELIDAVLQRGRNKRCLLRVIIVHIHELDIAVFICFNDHLGNLIILCLEPKLCGRRRTYIDKITSLYLAAH